MRPNFVAKDETQNGRGFRNRTRHLLHLKRRRTGIAKVSRKLLLKFWATSTTQLNQQDGWCACRWDARAATTTTTTGKAGTFVGKLGAPSSRGYAVQLSPVVAFSVPTVDSPSASVVRFPNNPGLCANVEHVYGFHCEQSSGSRNRPRAATAVFFLRSGGVFRGKQSQ